MRDLDTREIHGYLPNFGYRVYTEKAIETVGASVGLSSNGHHAAATLSPAPQKPSKKRPAKAAQQEKDDAVEATSAS
jgi:arginine decarboxylase